MNTQRIAILIGVTAGVAVALYAAVAAFGSISSHPNQPGIHACTEEAKQCPDGSYVGRTGPNCEFAPCPENTTLFERTGTIASTAAGNDALTLIYEEPGKPALTQTLTFDSASMCSSPTGTMACAAFNAPLSVPYGGKRVHVTGTQRGENVLVGRMEMLSDDVMPARVTMKTKLNEHTSGLGITVTPLEVTEDSRCATGVQCIWAGTVKVRATIAYGATTQQVIFERGMTIATNDLFITLTSVAPEKPKQGNIAPAEYRFTFEVTTRTDASR